MMILYTVRCSFPDEALAGEFIAWLEEEHLADVCAAGAGSATLVRLDGAPIRVEAQYRFASRELFDTYLRDGAPRLRGKTQQRFPPERGIVFERSVGEVIAQR